MIRLKAPSQPGCIGSAPHENGSTPRGGTRGAKNREGEQRTPTPAHGEDRRGARPPKIPPGEKNRKGANRKEASTRQRRGFPTPAGMAAKTSHNTGGARVRS